MQNAKDDGLEMMFWQQSSKAQVQVYTEYPDKWCSTDTGMVDFA
jgi:hypothetical protein